MYLAMIRNRCLRWFHPKIFPPLSSSARNYWSNAEASAHCTEPDPETRGFILQQTMYRIRDPKRSLDFYTRILGMRLLKKFDYPTMLFSLYYLGYEDAQDIPQDEDERSKWMFSRKACLELAHTWGAEFQVNFVRYHNGNHDPMGYGHIGIMVPDVDEACKRFFKLGVTFIKTPNQGKLVGNAFIFDPDRYWIEILNCTKPAYVRKD